MPKQTNQAPPRGEQREHSGGLPQSTRAELVEQVRELQHANTTIGDERRAALNLMEDAILSREALRVSEERQVFLLGLSDAIRSLIDADEINYTASRVLGEYIGADRVGYAEPNEANGTIEVARNYTNGVPSIEGVYLYEDYGRELLAEFLAGRTVVRGDIANDPTLSDAEKAAHRTLQLGATLNKPLVKEGRLLAVLFAHFREAHEWTAQEIRLLDEVGERVWSSIVRARAEEAVRMRNRQLDLLARTSQQLIIDGRDETNTLQTVFSEVADALETELFFNYLTPDGTAESLRLATSRGLTDEQKAQITIPAEGESLCLIVARQGEQQVVENIVGTESVEAALLHATGVRAYAGFPLHAGGRLLGTISFATRDRARFREGELQLIQTVCDQLAITLERARAEEVVRQSEQSFRAFVTASSQVIYKMNADWTEMRNLVGKDFLPDTLNPSRTWVETYIPGMVRPQVLASIEEAIRTKTPFEMEHQVTSMDGSIGWVFSRAVPLLDENGDIIEWIGTATNTTERKLAEEKLRKSEHRFRLAAQASHLYAWEANLVERKIYFSENAGPELGFAQFPEAWSEISTVFEPIHPDDRPRVSDAVRQAIANGRDGEQYTATYRQMTATGDYVWVESRANALRDASGRATHMYGVVLNVDARKRAEEELRESKARLQAITDLVPDLLWSTDPAGYTDWYNQQWFDYTGQTFEAAQGGGWSDVVHPDDRDESLRSFQTAFETGKVLRHQHRIRRHDGEYRSFLVQGNPLRDERGTIVRWFGASTDIHDASLASEALRQSEARLAAIFETLPVGVGMANTDGKFALFNQELQRYLPNRVMPSQEDISSERWHAFRPDGRPLEREEFPGARALRGERVVPGIEMLYTQDDGTQIWTQVSSVPVRDTNGQIVGQITAISDIDAFKWAERAVRESEARFHILTDAVPQVIWANDGKGDANYFNSRWFEYSGLSLDQSLVVGWQAIVHPDDAPASVERWNQALATGTVFDTEYRLRRADNTYRWHIGRNVPLRDEEGQVTGWFGSATDIEDLKEAQLAVHQSEERLRFAINAGELATWDWNVTRDLVYWNERHFLLFGMTPRDELVTSEDFAARVHPDDRARVEQCLMQAVENAGLFESEFRIIREDNGEIRWMNGSGVASESHAGRATRMSGVMYDSTERREAQEVLQRSHEELERLVGERTHELAEALARVQGLVKRVVGTQEEERGRISRELHDNLGQHLTAVMLGLQNLEHQIVGITGGKRKQKPPQLDKLRELVDGLMRAAHRQAWELRPAELDAMGLDAALGQYIRDWSARTGVETDFNFDDWQTRPEKEVETTLYRVTQEALTNVARHAQAKMVTITLESTSDEASVVVEDDGIGFDPDQQSGRLGVLGMQERLALVNGTLEIESIPDEGTAIIARVPLESPE